MFTRIVLLPPVAQALSGNENSYVDVEDSFDVVLERKFPLEQATSNLQARSQFIFKRTDQGLLYLDPRDIASFYECEEE